MAQAKNRLRLPWRRWDLHVIDCDGNGVAFNVGRDRADAIVKAMSAQESSTR